MKTFFIAHAASRVHSNPEIEASYFVAAFKQLRTGKTGKPYLCLTLSDRSGQIEARVWEDCESLGKTFEQGDVVTVEKATLELFGGSIQLRVEKIRKAKPEGIDSADLLPTTRRDVDAMWRELRAAVAAMSNVHLRRLCDSILDDGNTAAQLKQAPAAKSMHHAWIGGLLEHIVDLIQSCEFAARHFRAADDSPLVDRDLLVAGAILHDVGKIAELRWNNSFGYTPEGELVGHISLGVEMVQRKMEAIPEFPPRLRTLVKHMILSHHGRLEFGSPKLPMIAEAVLLNMLDDAEAKMQQISGALERHRNNGGKADQFTERVWALERSLLDGRRYLQEADAERSEAIPAGSLSGEQLAMLQSLTE